MSDSSGQDTQDQYDDGIAEVRKILASLDASEDEKDAAETALHNLTVAHERVILTRIEGRTKLLGALIQNLQQVIDSVQVESPVKKIADRLTGIVGKSTTLLTNINKDFLGKGGSTTPSS
jgi:hypothetical protein